MFVCCFVCVLCVVGFVFVRIPMSVICLYFSLCVCVSMFVCVSSVSCVSCVFCLFLSCECLVCPRFVYMRLCMLYSLCVLYVSFCDVCTSPVCVCRVCTCF